MSPKITRHSDRRIRSRWLITTSLCSALALSGCASAGGDKAAATAPRASAEAQISEPALRDAAVESTKTQDFVAAAAYWGELYDRNPNDAAPAPGGPMPPRALRYWAKDRKFEVNGGPK
jgi:hypothetical protein